MGLHPVFVSILIGLAALVAVSLSSALFLRAHLRGRVARPTALAVAVAAMAIGGTIAGTSAMGGGVFGPLAVPVGVFLMLAAGVNGLIVYQASKSTTGG